MAPKTGQQTALITGASGGIGLELARVFARNGHDLVLVARNGRRLEEEEINLTREFGVAVRTIPHDLSRECTGGYQGSSSR